MNESNNKNIAKIIKDMVRTNKIPGAFIFEGEDGGGKTSAAFADTLARAVVCADTGHKEKTGEACGICGACVKAIKGIHPDIIISEPESEGSLSFHIDKVRDIINGLYLTPNESDTKVYIIKDMQNMTPQGQNALLKSLEEPPPFAVFIITVSSCDLILETIKSRAVKFTPDSGVETSKSLSPYGDLINDILSENPDRLSVYQRLSAKNPEKNEIIKFYSDLENALRDILVAKIFMRYEINDIADVSFLYYAGGFDNFKEAEKLANLYSVKKILSLSKKIHKYKADLDYNINIRLNLTSFLSGLK